MDTLVHARTSGHAGSYGTRNKTASSWRFPTNELMRLYGRHRIRKLESQDPVAAQQHQLMALVRRAESTQFGRDHEFRKIRDVGDFQARVPLRTYTQLWEDYWKAAFPRLTDCTWPGTMPFFAVSSGTSSGQVKYIPCSEAMVRSNVQASLDIFAHHYNNRPDSRVHDGKSFALGGSTALNELAPGIRSGDISGIAAYRKPWWTEWKYFPSSSVNFMTDWEEKIDYLSRMALQEDIRFLSGAPAWLLVLFEKMAKVKPGTSGRIADFFPDLEILVHGGVSFAPYRQRFEQLLEGSKTELREVYPASEGFVAIADRGPGMGLRLIADNGIFYEFVPVEEIGSKQPTRHWLGTVEKNVDYAIVLTTCAGLWSYVIGDVVRFVDLNPPRLLITGRTSYMLSSFGEHLTGDLVEASVLAAAGEIGATLNEFSVGTSFSTDETSLGHHIYVVEFAEPLTDPARLAHFRERIDGILSERNEDYCERRLVEFGVDAPEVRTVPPGTFKAWMKSRGKLGGQHKVPRVINDAQIFESLLDFTAVATD